MKAKELVADLLEIKRKNVFRFESVRECIPLGRDRYGNVVVAHLGERPTFSHTVLVDGENKTEYLIGMICLLAGLYEDGQVAFNVLSPKREYARLLLLPQADVNVFYTDTKEQFEECRQALLSELENSKKKQIFVLDGLERFAEKSLDGTKPYIDFLDKTLGKYCEILMGIDLEKSLFSGFPGAIVGSGNAVLVLKGDGQANLTRVGEDSSLGVPTEIDTFDWDTAVSGVGNVFERQ